MSNEKRREAIIEHLKKHETARVNSIIELFDVTPATIRRDLTYLEKNGLVKRTHGGVRLIPRVSMPHYEIRNNVFSPEKQAIAAAAAKLVKDGDYVILDSGTTTHGILDNLKGRKNVSVITNSLSIASSITEDHPTVLYTGGNVDAQNQALIGPDAEAYFGKISASILFLGTTGIRGCDGLTAITPFHAQIKRQMLRSAQKHVLVVDSSKFSVCGMILFASFAEIDTIITNSPITDPQLLECFEQNNVEVIVAER